FVEVLAPAVGGNWGVLDRVLRILFGEIGSGLLPDPAVCAGAVVGEDNLAHALTRGGWYSSRSGGRARRRGVRLGLLGCLRERCRRRSAGRGKCGRDQCATYAKHL